MIIKSHLVPIIIALALVLSSGQVAAEVVAVVSAKNPVTSLSKNYVADIFLGKTSKFPDGSRAVPIDQAEGSATRDAFYLQFTGKSPAQVKMYWSKMIFTGRGQPPHEVPNGVEMKKYITENPNDIGYIERKLLDGTVKIISTQ